jgi:hypothetical protein
MKTLLLLNTNLFLPTLVFFMLSCGIDTGNSTPPQSTLQKTVLAKDTSSSNVGPKGGFPHFFDTLLFPYFDKISLNKEEAKIFDSMPTVGYTVSESGALKDVRMIKSTNVPRIDKEIVKVFVKSSPWNPAKSMGQATSTPMSNKLRISIK